MTEKSGVRISGAGVCASVDWMRTTYGESCWSGILGELPADDRVDIAGIVATDWIPVETEARRWEAFADHCHPRDQQAAEAAFYQMGRDIAQRNLTGVFKLADAFLQPESLIDYIPRLFALYCTGVEVDVGPVSDDGRDGTFTVRGLGQLPYVAPVIRGWISFALDQVGVTGASVTEESWDAGQTASDELVFHISW